MTPVAAFGLAFGGVCLLAGAIILWAVWQTREAMGMDSTERE